MLGSYGELPNRSSVCMAARIDIGTFFVFGKQRQRRLRIAIHLPISAELAVPAGIVQKTQHIARRIAQKQADFVRKLPGLRQAAPELQQAALHRSAAVAASAENAAAALCGQIALQAVRPANIHQRPPAGYAQQPYAHALFAQPLVQGRRLFRKRMECALMMQVAQRLDPELAKNAVKFESDCDGCGEGNDGACEK